MSDRSAIEWTDASWNPLTGCTQVTPGCDHCYAKTFAERFRGVKDHPYEQGFDFRLWPERLELPLRWRQPRRVFVNSMSDLFQNEVPEIFIVKVFEIMGRADHHVFQLLTKRSARLARLRDVLPWPDNVWVGVSIENNAYVSRANHLRKVPAAVRFISAEPLLGPLDRLNLEGVDWVITGGESGPGYRPCDPDWVRDVRDRCNQQGIAFFHKQWGGIRPKAKGRVLDGRTWDEMPASRLVSVA